MDRWKLVYEGFDPDEEGLREALCTLGNGYFATRGATSESTADGVHYPGTYVAGLYDRLVTSIGGRDIENEDLVNLPNWLVLRVRPAGGEWFDPALAEVDGYTQELDLRRGVLTRSCLFEDGQGRRTSVVQTRFVSMADPHLAGMRTVIRAENWSGGVEVHSALDGRVLNSGVARYRDLEPRHLIQTGAGFTDEETMHLRVRTTQSGVEVAVAAMTRLERSDTPLTVSRRNVEEEGYIAQDLRFRLDEGVSIDIDKLVVLYTSRDRAISEAGLAARRWISRSASFDESLEDHVRAWELLWARFHVDTGAEDYEAMVLALHSFHLLQTVSPHTVDLDVGVPARGWHGEAYRGHVFWDELFIFPYLNLRLPDLTRSLLMYRWRRLPEARFAAREAGLAGALFPWQSGSSGREESQFVHLNPASGNWMPDNSRLQRHVNIAIAYNVWQYHQTTGDLDFLARCGAEMLVEIARLLVSLTSYDPDLDRYEILGVMGPDEFHDAYPGASEPGIDNNAYTNVMAAWVLNRARDALSALPEHAGRRLRTKLRLDDEEMGDWHDVSRKLVVPVHGNGIISQFQGYGNLAELDWDGYRERYGDIQRLDRILEAEGDSANRYQASKQADVLMLFYLLSVTELRSLLGRLGYELTDESIQRNIDYYVNRTTHGSTLSRLVCSWVLVRSDRDKSWGEFRRALLSDVADVQGGTTREGIHLGAMAGTVDLVQRGYTGLEVREDTLWLKPELPDELGYLDFQMRYRGHLIDLHIANDRLELSSHRGPARPIRVGIEGRVTELAAGTGISVDL
jgi:alpha,alpha-trehalase